MLILFSICDSYMPLSGFQGVLAGFLVGIKQIVPDQELYLLKIKAKVLTFLTNLFNLIFQFESVGVEEMSFTS